MKFEVGIVCRAEISAASFLGTPGEGFTLRNFTYVQLGIGTLLGRIIVGKLFLRPFYRYRVVSIYEYLEMRFGTGARRCASLVFLLSRVLASGTRLFFAGILLVIAYTFSPARKARGRRKPCSFTCSLSPSSLLSPRFIPRWAVSAPWCGQMCSKPASWPLHRKNKCTL